MSMQASTRIRGRDKALWFAVILLLSATTAGIIFGLNRFVHSAYVTFGGPSRSLRIMTWNVGRIYLRLDSRASDRDLGYVAQVIREVNPQVVALQEMRDAKQLGRLLTLLGRNWHGRVPKDSYDRRAALLVRMKARYFELPTSSGRTAQGAVLSLPGGREITVASVHLDAFDPKRRLQQAEEIVANALRLGRKEVFIAGDFNLDVSSTRDSADQGLYQFLTRHFVDAGETAGATTLGARRLDYVFHRSSRVKVRGARVLRTRRIDSLDHHPLVVEYQLR
jgi:endonuclease/exonuclease/phosphatase family metal-dependent hydrolase